MNTRNSTLAALSTAAALALSLASQAQATTVATISGSYDLLFYDTAALTFHNTSGGTLTNAKMSLLGYQPGTLNVGKTATVSLGSLATGDTNYIWLGPTTPGNLTAYDYDDEWGNTPSGYTNPGCVVGGGLCSLVGNFSVVFTATISGGVFNGAPVFSVFSPTSNFTGGFVGWEGLDPTGLSETIYDQHQGSITGTLAVINIGLPPGVPEPGLWAMMLTGFGAMGAALRGARRKRGMVGA